ENPDGRIRSEHRGRGTGLGNGNAMAGDEIAGAAGASEARRAGSRVATDGGRRGRARIAAEAGDIHPGIRPLGAEVGVNILRRGEGVRRVGLRAAARTKRTNLRAGVVLVVEALVGGLGVEIHSARAGAAGRRGLIREI